MPDTRHDPLLPPCLVAFRQARDREGPVILDDGVNVVRVVHGGDCPWLAVRHAGGSWIGIRMAHGFGADYEFEEKDGKFTASHPFGQWESEVEVKPVDDALIVRRKLFLTPSHTMRTEVWPRDMVIDDGKPGGSVGDVHALSKGHNAGVAFVTSLEEGGSTVFYFQEYTTLNPYYQATDTTPDGAVGGTYPEVGYQPPVGPHSILEAGLRMPMSDAFVVLRPAVKLGDAAEAFLRSLDAIYESLDQCELPRHDYVLWSRRTHECLATMPSLLHTFEGHKFPLPYVGATVPDSMVQTSIAASMHRMTERRPEFAKCVDVFTHATEAFVEPDFNAIARYLPDVPEERQPDRADSWYNVFPLINLARMAKRGHERARELMRQSIPNALRVARHFDYKWPIFYSRKTLEPMPVDRGDGSDRQTTDLAGTYAYMMLQAYDLFGEVEYLEEAKRGVRASRQEGFSEHYQANLVGWGIAAAMRLYAMTGDHDYCRRAQWMLANLLLNTVLWESEIKHASEYPTFMAMTCLHNAAYAAAFEIYDTADACMEVLEQGDQVPEPMRRLLTEVTKFANAQYGMFYPLNLSPDVLAKETLEGRLERGLPFPLEDLYPDGQPAGQVGQEIYGCGGAFVFAERCTVPLADGWELRSHLAIGQARLDGDSLEFQLLGSPKSKGLAWLGRGVEIVDLGEHPAGIVTRLEVGEHIAQPAASLR